MVLKMADLLWILPMGAIIFPGIFLAGRVWQKRVEDNNKEKIIELEKQIKKIESRTPAEEVTRIISRLRQNPALGVRFFVIRGADKKNDGQYICLSCLIQTGNLRLLDYEIRRQENPNQIPNIWYKKTYECKLCEIKCDTRLTVNGAVE